MHANAQCARAEQLTERCAVRYNLLFIAIPCDRAARGLICHAMLALRAIFLGVLISQATAIDQLALAKVIVL